MQAERLGENPNDIVPEKEQRERDVKERRNAKRRKPRKTEPTTSAAEGVESAGGEPSLSDLIAQVEAGTTEDAANGEDNELPELTEVLPPIARNPDDTKRLPRRASGGDIPRMGKIVPPVGKLVESGSENDIIYRQLQKMMKSGKDRAEVHQVEEDELEKPWWMDHLSGGGELPRFAGGTSDFLSGMTDEQLWELAETELQRKKDTGQKERPQPYNLATWMANSKNIESLRDALISAGYSAKRPRILGSNKLGVSDVAKISSNQDVLNMWKAGWSLADLRRTNLIPHDPYDPDDIEVTEATPATAAADPSIQQAPPPPIPGVRLNKRGEIITARKGKSRRPPQEEYSEEESSGADKPLPLTRKRPKPFFSDGGDLPHYASGGGGAGMAIVGDLPGQSLDSIKGDPHTEVVVGNRVVSHGDALRRGLFDGKKPRYATGYPGGFGPPPPPLANLRRGRLRGGSYGKRNKSIRGVNRGAVAPMLKAAVGPRHKSPASRMAGMAGGPVAGAIVQAVEMITAGIISAQKAVIGGASAIANWSASGPNVGGDIAAFGGAVSKAGEDLSKISPVAGIVVSAFGETGKALGTFMQAMDGAINRYAEVNPAVAQQQAIGEIRQVMGDMRRGQEIAPQMVRYMQTQQDLQQKFEDIKIKVLNQILKLITPIMDTLERLLPEGEAVGDAISALLAPLVALANAVATMVNVQRDDRLQEVQDPAAILLNGGINGTGNLNNFNEFGRGGLN